MNKFILTFKESRKELEYLVGKYAASIGDLTNAGLPVVDGFIVTPTAYFSFIHKNNLIKKITELLATTNIDHPESLMQTSINIKKLIKQSPFPEDLTSNIHNFYKNLSGVLSFVQVNIISGSTGEILFSQVSGDTNLVMKIKESWAQYFSPTQILSLHEKGQDYFKNGVSLIIQKHLEPDESGVMLTGNPVNNDTSQMIVEVKGVHEHYEIQKNTLKIINRVVSTKSPHLSFDQIKTLALIGKNIETQLFFPQEIYWIIHNNNFYILRCKNLPFHHDISKTPLQITKNLNLLVKGTGISAGVIHGTVKIIKKPSDFAKIIYGDIVVVNDVPQNYLSTLKKSSAVISEQGGKTSPIAFFSRANGIPAVANIKNALSLFKSGQVILVNGESGEIYTSHTLFSSQKTATRVFLNLNQSYSEDMLTDTPVDCILYAGQHENDLSMKLEKISQVFSPNPIIYKISDFASILDNPFGFRGTYRAIHNDYFKKELIVIKNLKEKNDLKNIAIMLPFVRNSKELLLAKEIMNDLRLHRDNNLKLWIEVSTPASVINLEELIKTGIDGVCLNIDTLTTLLTGVDEKMSEVAHIFDPLDASVVWAIESVVKSSHQHGISALLSGKSLIQHSSLIEKAVKFGITGICASPKDIHSLKEMIRNIEKKLVETS